MAEGAERSGDPGGPTPSAPCAGTGAIAIDPSKTRILIADDQGLFRDGLRRVLEECPAHRVVGEARDAAETLELAEESGAELLLLDLALPDGSGLAVTRRLLESGTKLRILMVSASEALAPVEDALRAGAAGWVSKSASARELLAGIDAIRVGGSYLSPSVARRVTRSALGSEGARSPLSLLSGREREVLAWLAEGLSSREIGARLGVSPRTIDSHRVRLMKKLGIHRVQGLVRLAIREGLVDP